MGELQKIMKVIIACIAAASARSIADVRVPMGAPSKSGGDRSFFNYCVKVFYCGGRFCVKTPCKGGSDILKRLMHEGAGKCKDILHGYYNFGGRRLLNDNDPS